MQTGSKNFYDGMYDPDTIKKQDKNSIKSMTKGNIF